MRHLETCLLIAKLTEFCIILCLFPLDVQFIKYSCYQDTYVIHGWFVNWVFDQEMRRLAKSFETSMRKRFKKSQAILALLDTFQELHLDW